MGLGRDVAAKTPIEEEARGGAECPMSGSQERSLFGVLEGPGKIYIC